MGRNYENTSSLLRALAHPVRLEIVDILRHGEVCVCHIEAALGRRQAYVSQQLMILRDAGLVESRKEGLQVYYRLTNRQVVQLLETLYGPPDEANAPILIEGCGCPSCSTLLRNDPQGAKVHVTG